MTTPCCELCYGRQGTRAGGGIYCNNPSCPCHSETRVEGLKAEIFSSGGAVGGDGKIPDVFRETEWEKEHLRRKYDVATWMRARGIEDGQTFKAEDMQEYMEDFWEDSKPFIRNLLSSREAEIVEGVEKLRKENKRTEKWSDDYYHALDAVLSLIRGNKTK